MIEVQCDECKKTFRIPGHINPGGTYEPDELVYEMETDDDDLCDCLMAGGMFTVLQVFDPPIFDDDVI